MVLLLFSRYVFFTTNVCANENTSLSTRENSVPIIPGMYFPDLQVS